MEQEVKHARWKKNQTSTNRVTTARLTVRDKKPNHDLYLTGKAFMTRKANTNQGN